MDHLLTFAYAAPDALDQDALDRSIVQDVRQNQVFQPIGRLSVKALQNVQQEVRTLLEAAADGQDPIRLRPPIGALSPYLMKPPAGRLPKRLAGQYLQLVSGKWRDVVLAYSCNVISHGGGAGLKRCEVCARAFRAQRSTATLCPRRACKRERNSQAWKRWVTGKGKEKRLKQLEEHYYLMGWRPPGARGGLGVKKGRKKR